MNSVQCIMHCVRTFILLKNCHIWLGSCMEKKALTISNWVYFYCLSDNIVRIMYCTYFLIFSFILPPPSSQPFTATVFYYCWYKSRSLSQKKSESYSVILKWGYKLLCKSLLITEYSGHVPLKSWSFFRMLTGTQKLQALFPTLWCASWASELNISSVLYLSVIWEEHNIFLFFCLLKPWMLQCKDCLFFIYHVQYNCSNSFMQNFRC